MDTDYADDIALLENTPANAESLLHVLEKAAGGIDLHINADKLEYMSFSQNKKRRHIHAKRWVSETSGQVGKPRKQRIIYWKRHQYATSECMASYRLAIRHMEVRPAR